MAHGPRAHFGPENESLKGLNGINIKHAKHTASIISPVDMQTCSHRWNSTKTHAMSNPDPPSFLIFVIQKKVIFT